MPPTGIDNLKDLVETITLLIGTVAILWGVLTYRVTRNQFNFSVMISCIERFQIILPQLNSTKEEIKLQAIKQYVDLCNEELFYFKRRYVPDEVVGEWIEGMASYLPWFDSEGHNYNLKALQEIEQHHLLQDYPRVCRAFKVTRAYNLDCPIEKKELLDVVKQNIKCNYD